MTQTSDNKHLRRSDDRVIAGVCSGLAEYLGIDVTLVRIIAAVLALIGGGGVLIYLVAWLVMPDARGTVIARRSSPTQPSTQTPTEPPAETPTD